MSDHSHTTSANLSTGHDDLPQQDSNRRLGQLKLLALFAIAVVPVVLAAIMYFGRVGVPDTSTNNGTLVLPPLQADTVPALAEIWQREAMRQVDDKPKWLLSVFGDMSATTTDALQRDQAALYLARQVTVAVGKDQDRIAYGWLQRGLNAQSGQAALSDFSELQLIEMGTAAETALRQWLGTGGITPQPGDLVLADPNGNFIMYYPKTIDGKAILEDLKRLLKVSKIG